MSPSVKMSQSTPQLNEFMVGVHINGQPASEFAVLLQDGPHYYATATLLKEWRLREPKGIPLNRNGEAYYPLDAMDGITSTLDENLQILFLKIPAKHFVNSVLQADDRQANKIDEPDPGVFLNHDFQYIGAGTSGGISGFIESGAFSKLGVLTSRFVIRNLMQTVQPIRLDTQFVRDAPSRMTTFKIGDCTSATNPWALQVYYGGVSWASKFSTQPSFISVALPSMAGQVTVPSTVDLYVNNTRLSQQQVDPGPFSIQNVPVMTGQGEMRMVITDVLGRQEVVTQPYIRAAAMLRKGASEYNYEAGSLRYGFGAQHSGYTSVFAAGTQRYGLTNSLTINGRAEIQAKNQVFGVGADRVFPHIGVVSAAIALSHSGRGGGALAHGEFQHQSRSFGFSANLLVASSNFRQLGLQAIGRTPRLTAQAQLSHSLGKKSSLAVGYLRREGRSRIGFRNDPNVADFSGITTSLSLRLSKQATLISSVSYAPGSKTRTTASLGLIIPLGSRDLLMASSQMDKDNKTATFDYTHQAPVGNGYGYRFRGDAADGKAVDAGLYLQGSYGSYVIESGMKPDATSWRFGETGSVVLFHGKVIPTRWLSDSFGVVEIPQPGIRVLANNQYIASTGRRGIVVLPSMAAYSQNVVRIDGQGVPIDLQISLEERRIVPMPRTGVFVKFTAARVQGALLVLTLENGLPVPLGAEVKANSGTEEYMVALHGEVFVQEITLPGHIVVQWNNRQCEADVPATPENDPLPRIGPIVCKSTK